MDFGLMFFASSEDFQEGDKYHLIIESAKFGDANGFSAVWIPERHFTKFGCLYPNPAVVHAALARETSHIQLRAGSVVLPIHDPIRVVEEWAVVDNLSGGRVGISFASGWNPDDFAFFPDRYSKRHDEMYASIPVVRRLWKGDPIKVISGNGNEVMVKTFPAPVQAELPIWITAAGNSQTFIKAGQLGANLLTHALDLDLETLGEKISLYREAREANGHDPLSGKVTVMLHTYVGKDQLIVREQARKPFCDYLKSNFSLLKGLAQSRGEKVDFSLMSPESVDEFVNFLFERFASERGLIGTPETCLSLLHKLDAIGVDEVACLLDFGPPQNLVIENLSYLNDLKSKYNAERSPERPLSNKEPHRINSRSHRQKEQPITFESFLASTSDIEPLAIVNPCLEELTHAAFYDLLSKSNIIFNEKYQLVKHIWRGKGKALARISIPPAANTGVNGLMKPLLDVCSEVFAAILPDEFLLTDANGSYAPVSIKSIDVLEQPGGELWSYAVLGSDPATFDQAEGNIYVFNNEGRLHLKITGFRIKKTDPAPVSVSNLTRGYGNWLYEFGWEQMAPMPITDKPTYTDKNWIIFADRGGVGREIARVMKIHGTNCILLFRGDRHEVSDDQTEYAIDPFQEHSVRILIESILAKGLIIERCLHLWSLDVSTPQDITINSLKENQIIIVDSALELIQAIGNSTFEKHPHLWFVTSGAQFVAEKAGQVSAHQATLWGLARTVPVEYPQIRTSLADLEPGTDDGTAALQLMEILSTPGNENLIAVRNNKRYVARLARLPLNGAEKQPVRFVQEAAYLITGGTGGLGLKLAEWLIENNAKHLILLCRNEPSVHAKEVIDRLTDSGAEIMIAKADVSAENEMARVFTEIGRTMPVLKGVFHLAGLADANFLCNQTRDSFGRVRAAKVEGTWNLHTMTLHMDLDHFVMFSSAASMINQPGQGNYSSASAFMDSMAYQRKHLSLPSLCINWGPWGEVGHITLPGMDKVYSKFRAIGVEYVIPEEGLQVLGYLLQQNKVQVGVVSVDWDRFIEMQPAGASPLQANLISADLSSGPSVSDETSIFRACITGDAETRSALLVNYLTGIISAILCIDTSLLNAQQSLMNLGLDSLMSIEIRNKIKKEFHVDIPIVQFLQGTTIQLLAAEIMNRLDNDTQEIRRDARPDLTCEYAGNGIHSDPNDLQNIDQIRATEMLLNLEELSEEELDKIIKTAQS